MFVSILKLLANQFVDVSKIKLKIIIIIIIIIIRRRRIGYNMRKY